MRIIGYITRHQTNTRWLTLEPIILDNEHVQNLARDIIARDLFSGKQISDRDIFQIGAFHPYGVAITNMACARVNGGDMPAFPASITSAVDTIKHEMYENCSVVPVLIKGGEFRNGSGEIILREIDEMHRVCEWIENKNYDFIKTRVAEQSSVDTMDFYHTLDDQLCVSLSSIHTVWMHFFVKFRVMYANQVIGQF